MKKTLLALAAIIALAVAAPAEARTATVASNGHDFAASVAAPFTVNFGPVQTLQLGAEAQHFDRADTNVVGATAGWQWNVTKNASITPVVGAGLATGGHHDGLVTSYGVNGDYAVTPQWTVGLHFRHYDGRHGAERSATQLALGYNF